MAKNSSNDTGLMHRISDSLSLFYTFAALKSIPYTIYYLEHIVVAKVQLEC